jgi:cellulose synthase/poly-beta-1,6-N-acetylglucosamine synthase-like glycosyltransferase
MTNLAHRALIDFDWSVLVYFLVLNTIFLLLVGTAAVNAARTMSRTAFKGFDDIFANPLTPAVSVLVPAYNEAKGIVQSVGAMLQLRYPEFEVVVIEDGSTDDTFARLASAFDLVEVPRVVPQLVPSQGKVLSVHVPRGGEPLVVVRKENISRRADALAVGVNVAQYPLVCMVDADSILEEGALLGVAKPFVDDPEHVVAVGGVLRAVNGTTVEGGRIIDARMPKTWVERIQVVEYLRSFFLGRVAWARMNGLLIVSGAFGLFRRDIIIEVGGLRIDSLGEDAELVTTIHEHLRKTGARYRVAFASEPICWTEVPSTARVLARQRRRWSYGLAQVLWNHKRMIGNPRYGRMGLVVMPYYLVFELLAPIVELVGVAAVVGALALGWLNLGFALLFAVVSVLYGVFLSVAALAIEEFSARRSRRWSDLLAALGAAVLENVGFRQAHAWWRLRGLVAAMFHRSSTWGEMPRDGFTPPSVQVADPARELVSARR